MRHRSESYVRQPVTGARWLLGVLAAVVNLAQAQTQTGLTEEDFFEPVPVVLTVSRLAQSLHDTPGAVTVLDRDAIRRSGARTLADLLRLVPGYIVSGYNGANPTAAYHAPLDEYGARNLVLVDGRSLYSTTYLAGTNRGMLTVSLDDIERIEVLRGSNSAAYGANAMFGVINVVTRHSADTLGGAVSLSVGNALVRDASVRIGWGDASASHRLTVGRRADSGYRFVYDSTQQNSVQWRSDLKQGADTTIFFSAGYTSSNLGDGVPNNYDNPERNVSWEQAHAHFTYTRDLSESEQIRWAFSWDEDRSSDAYEYPDPSFPPGIWIDSGASERRLNLEFQHQLDFSPKVRVVWGAGLKDDSAISSPLFFTSDRLSARDTRIFGNLEWRLTDRWLLNAGLFAGHNSDTGGYASPRLMVNYHWLPEHTFRFGASTAQKAPTLFQKRANVQYFVPGANIYIPTFVSSGNVRPEQLETTEISYYGPFPDAQLTLDVRAYEEHLTDEIKSRVVGPGDIQDFQNLSGSISRGMEYQVKWSPVPDAQLVWNHAVTRLTRPLGDTFERMPPESIYTLGWMQQLPAQWDVSLWWHSRSAMTWRGSQSKLNAANRVDLRLAKQFRLGKHRAEVAFTVQALNGDQVEFTSRELSMFERRAFASLRVEF